jgi:hypothetical protein
MTTESKSPETGTPETTEDPLVSEVRAAVEGWQAKTPGNLSMYALAQCANIVLTAHGKPPVREQTLYNYRAKVKSLSEILVDGRAPTTAAVEYLTKFVGRRV